MPFSDSIFLKLKELSWSHSQSTTLQTRGLEREKDARVLHASPSSPSCHHPPIRERERFSVHQLPNTFRRLDAFRPFVVVCATFPMGKDGQQPATTLAVAKQIRFLCFVAIYKPLIATLLSLALVMFIWNLQPYYENILPTTFRSSCPTPPSSMPEKLQNPTPNPAQDPNKRSFTAYGNAAALFVQMGAYRGGPRTFAVIGLSSKPLHVFGNPWYSCEWISNNGSRSIKSKAYKILPDWGYGRVYTVIVVNCTFPTNPNADNAGGKLILSAYYTNSSKRHERITALEEVPGSYQESRYNPPYQYDYLYCGSSLYGNLNPARMREWMAYHAWFFGPKSHFVFHDAGGISPEVRAVLQPWINAGRLTVQDIRNQAEYDGYYYNQFLIVNDCLHRYRHAANWTFYFDVDEYIYLPDQNSTLESVLNEFKFSNNTQITIEQNAMSSLLCLNDSNHDLSREWGFEKLIFRDQRKKIRRDRKYAIQPRNAFATGVHMSENVVGGTLHKTETKIRYYHYHNSITVHEELCRQWVPSSEKNNVTWFDRLPYVYDDNMKKLAPVIREFERNYLNQISSAAQTAAFSSPATAESQH